MCSKQDELILPLNVKPFKLVDHFTNLESNISSIKSDANLRIGKMLTDIDGLRLIWKSDLSDKIK